MRKTKLMFNVFLYGMFLFLFVPMIVAPELYQNDSLICIRLYAVTVLLWVIDNHVSSYLGGKKDKLTTQLIEELKQKIKLLEMEK